MLIVSKYKDFYDSATIGVDKELVYKRDTALISVDFDRGTTWRDSGKYVLRHDGRSYQWNEMHNHTMFVIGFCGKEYVGAFLNCSANWHDGLKRYNQMGLLAHNKPAIEGHITFDQEEILEYFKPNKRHSWDVRSHNKLSDFMERTHGHDNDDLFIKHRAPIYLIVPQDLRSGKKLIINPVLKDLEFMRVVDPYTAFQELEMYLGDTLRMRDKDTIEISDKDRAASKGFDKWSFRRESHPSKPRRKKK